MSAQWAGFETIVFCENDEYCQKVIRKHWPDVPIIPDIRDFDGTKWRGATLLTGGFPCQPFSIAGKQRGTDDDRHLWPAMLKVIEYAKPTWVIGENVIGFVEMGLGEAKADLESIGYQVECFTIPASACNATHKRGRVWVVAYSEGKRRDEIREVQENIASEGCEEERKQLEQFQLIVTRNYYVQLRKGSEADICRSDNGVPTELDKARLKALGNAIVPQVAYEIIKGIAEIERT